ncbi:MAG: DUF3343 domain-containing protein [Elusimicrobiota bacterium]
MPEKKYYLSFPSTHQLFYFAELLQKHKIKRNLIPALPGMAGSCSTLIEIVSGEISRVKALLAAENQRTQGKIWFR